MVYSYIAHLPIEAFTVQGALRHSPITPSHLDQLLSENPREYAWWAANKAPVVLVSLCRSPVSGEKQAS